MNNGGDAAEQVVRLSLEGFEVAATKLRKSIITSPSGPTDQTTVSTDVLKR